MKWLFERCSEKWAHERVVTLMAVRTHQLAALRFAPYSNGETTLAKTHWAQVPDNALVIVDRGFWDGSALFPLQDHGATATG